MSVNPLDIIILGATVLQGVTGRLAAAYLAKHPQRAQFTFGISGRSNNKLEVLTKELGEPDLPTFIVDTTKADQVKKVVQNAKVIINTVGPLWKYGLHVVDACLEYKVHHLDFGGDGHWLGTLVREYDYAATSAGILFIPACAYFCLPADLAVYMGHRTLEDTAKGHVDIDTSVSAYEGVLSVSGGTFGSLLSGAEELTSVPEWRKEYPLSPVVGPPFLRRSTHRLDIPEQSLSLVGTSDFTNNANLASIERAWGLRELEARKNPLYGHYGPTFKYEEFTVRNRAVGLILTSILSLFLRSLSFIPFRWLARVLGPKPGDGPSPEAMKKNWFKITNLTTSASKPSVKVKTVVEGKGDPGYLLSSHMIAETALAIVLDRDSLPELGKRGGVLTPTIALGDVLVKRLKKAGFMIESNIIS